jgi:hypothetical protein
VLAAHLYMGKSSNYVLSIKGNNENREKMNGRYLYLFKHN